MDFVESENINILEIDQTSEKNEEIITKIQNIKPNQISILDSYSANPGETALVTNNYVNEALKSVIEVLLTVLEEARTADNEERNVQKIAQVSTYLNSLVTIGSKETNRPPSVSIQKKFFG